MQRLKNNWKRTPSTIRKPLVFILGALFIIAAGLTGWLPGPGGIPLFLIGIAILATEFAWAKRVRDKVLGIVEKCGRLFRRYPVYGTIILMVFAAGAIFIGITVWRSFYG